MISLGVPNTSLCRWLVRQVITVAALVFLPRGAVSAAELCVHLERDGQAYRSIRAASGSELRLRFRHSIYGSEVEETFHILPDGFQLVQLRYGEARLAEFYGHETAKQDRGAWVVRLLPRRFRALDLQVSADSTMSLIVGAHTRQLNLIVRPGAAVRAVIGPCRTRDG
jgi:hypothetical protein